MRLTAAEQRATVRQAAVLAPLIAAAARDSELGMLRLEARAHDDGVGAPGPTTLHLGTDPRAWGACQGSTGGLECGRPSGEGTEHPGVGRCRRHGGRTRRESRRVAWVVAHAYARELDVTPWQALLAEVRRSAGALAWLDGKVAEAPDDDALRPGGDWHPWVRMRNEERVHGARVAKMALDAGVADRLVAQAEYEGSQVAGVLARTLDALVGAGLSPELLSLARATMRTELLALDGRPDEAPHPTVDGTVVDNVVKGPWRD